MLDAAAVVSVIIPNYNYARFVADAIESALALDWPNVEVIVVDDGSTDGSRAVIERYVPRVTAIFQANAGQATACRVGFERSRGDVVIFLDSDDCLEARLVLALAAVWEAGVSKVQFQMKTIDADGLSLGSVFPQYYRVPSSTDIRRWTLAAAAYPTPPGSGNAYAREFIDRVIPSFVDWDRASDSCLLAAAPLLGRVVTIAEPLVSYRIHGKNQGAMLELDLSRFAAEWLRARHRFQFAQGIAFAAGLQLRDEAFNRSLSVLVYRASSFRLTPTTHPVADDSIWGLMSDAMRAFAVPQGFSLPGRISLFAWLVLVCLLPQSSVMNLVRWRFIPRQRPASLRWMMGALRVARR